MKHTLLIANRGEIAVRIMRTAKAMGMRTVAVYSRADEGALHVRTADHAICIGPGPARESYLSIERVLAAAIEAKATIIHPGYGFLSENTDFAAACAGAGIVFVGPPAKAIHAMGRKDEAKALAIQAGVPVVPGYAGADQTEATLLAEAQKIGYPVAIKAVAGGGGRGLRRVGAAHEFVAALQSAQREALSGFGDAHVLLEKWIDKPRHIEVQIMADSHGSTLYLAERDCTLQRRHQKVIEEAPAPGMTAEVRKAMGEAAVKAAKAVGYVGAGTVEMIVDASAGLKPDGFYFMEMNTRLQVEHPVTEAITGLDLVALQLKVALGEKLPLTQEQVRMDGHAIEARIYAEDPAHGFRPSVGRIAHAAWPKSTNGVRIDHGYESGDAVSPHYDAMLAKVIIHAPTREAALADLRNALQNTLVLGVKSNIGFLHRLLGEKAVEKATFDTGLIDRDLDRLTKDMDTPPPQAIASAVLTLLTSERQGATRGTRRAGGLAWATDDGFDLTGTRALTRTLSVEGMLQPAQLEWLGGELTITIAGKSLRSSQLPHYPSKEEADAIHVWANAQSWVIKKALQQRKDLQNMSSGEVRAPLPGKVAAILKAEGDAVEEGEAVAVLEAMKMEHTLKAPISGTIKAIHKLSGAQVTEGDVLVVII